VQRIGQRGPDPRAGPLDHQQARPLRPLDRRRPGERGEDAQRDGLTTGDHLQDAAYLGLAPGQPGGDVLDQASGTRDAAPPSPDPVPLAEGPGLPTADEQLPEHPRPAGDDGHEALPGHPVDRAAQGLVDQGTDSPGGQRGDVQPDRGAVLPQSDDGLGRQTHTGPAEEQHAAVPGERVVDGGPFRVASDQRPDAIHQPSRAPAIPPEFGIGADADG
jgi:hypothetical protein